jgi:hypothetical protein
MSILVPDKLLECELNRWSWTPSEVPERWEEPAKNIGYELTLQLIKNILLIVLEYAGYNNPFRNCNFWYLYLVFFFYKF